MHLTMEIVDNPRSNCLGEVVEDVDQCQMLLEINLREKIELWKKNVKEKNY